MGNPNKLETFVHSKLSIILLGLLTAFGPLTIDMYVPAFPSLTSDLNTTSSLTQLSLTATLLGLAVGQLIAGSLSDYHGRRKPLIITLIVYIIASLLCAIAINIWMLIFFRLLQGISGAGGVVIARTSVRDLYVGSELTRIFSMLMLVMGVAPILAPILGGQLLLFFSWRGIFVALAILGALMLLFVLFRFPETLSKENKSIGGVKNYLATFKTLLIDRTFMGYAVIMGLVTGAMFAYISGSSFVFQDYFDVSPQGYSLIFAMNAAGIIIASQITGRIAGKISETKLLKIGLTISSIASIVLLLTFILGGGIVFVLIPMFFVVSAIGIVSPTCTSLAMQTKAKVAGSATAFIGFFHFTFGGLVAPLVGIMGRQSVLPLGIVIAILQIIAVSCFFFVLRVNRNTPYKEQYIS